jgi:hypothetical protein
MPSILELFTQLLPPNLGMIFDADGLPENMELTISKRVMFEKKMGILTPLIYLMSFFIPKIKAF